MNGWPQKIRHLLINKYPAQVLLPPPLHLQFAEIWNAMSSLRKCYLVCFIKVDSAHLGSPAMRRRIYFILVRRHDLFFESEALQQKHAFLQLIGISLNHMTCTRDVACATIKDHCQLEAHCNQVYQKLKPNFVTHLGPPASYVWLPKNSPSIRDRSVAPEVRPAPSRWLPIPPGRSEGFGC